MNKLQKIYDLCVEKNIKTITFDVFDTVLIRKIHPENRQFLMVAKKWLPLFQEVINKEITAEKIYYYRVYARNELFDVNNKYVIEKRLKDKEYYDVTLKSWFTNLVKILAMTYNVSLGTRIISSLVDNMIDLELETEIENLAVNKVLIKQIEKIKINFPEIKMYFVSDMYLTTNQVQKLLSSLGVRCFDGGITSTDARSVKWDGSIFYRLSRPEIFGEKFDVFKNLHIGDNRKSDYLMPIKAGSYALWLKQNNNRVKKKNEIGKKLVKKDLEKIKKTERLKLKKELSVGDSNNDIWIKYGELFSLPLISFLVHVMVAAENCSEVTFMLVSSEGKTFKKIADKWFSEGLTKPNVIIANKLNRRTMIRAIIWQLINDEKLKYNIHSIIEHVYYGETDNSRIELYKFIFGEKYPCSELSLNLRNDKEFMNSLCDELLNIDKKYSSELVSAYKYVYDLAVQIEKCVIVDVGWGGTVQTLFTEFCNNLKGQRHIEGLYLGAHPADRFAINKPHLDGYLMKNVRDGEDREIWNAVIWEYAYTNKIQFDADACRLDLMQEGLRDGINFFKTATLSPYDYFSLVVRKRIRRLLQKPTRKEVLAIGNIELDMGFIEKSSFFIVNTDFTQKEFYKMLIKSPRNTIKNIIFYRNNWPAGYMKYYRLYGLKTLIRIYGKFKGKRYI